MNRTPRLAASALVCVLAAAGCARVPPDGGGAPPPTSAAPSASASASGSTSASAPTWPTPPNTTPTPGTPAPGTCAALAAGLSLEEQVGQLVMVGVTGGLDEAERSAITGASAGSVILVGTSTAGVTGTRALTDRIAALAGPGGMLVAADQEGGRVQRLQGPGFDTIPSAAEQATLSPGQLTTKAAGWGRQLADAGVRLDLAPVADVVPSAKVGTNEPIGKLQRGYGSDPAVVGERVAAFVTGLQRAGVGTSAKHFPNLGQVVGNTDFAAGVVDTVTTADDPALEAFRAAISAGTDTVMMSTAVYTRLDPGAPAAFSPAVVGLLRDRLGFTGVVISDDLGVAEAVAEVPARERLLRFVRAGGDLAISVDPQVASAMARGMADAAVSDPALRERVARSAERVLALKGALGVASCQPVVG